MENKLFKVIKMSIIYSSLGLVFQLLLVNLIFAFTPVKAQGLERVNVNVNIKNSTLEKTLTILENQTEYKFFYIKEDIPLNSMTTIKAENKPLNSVLEQLAIQHNLVFKRINNQIVVKKANEYVKENDNTKIIGRVTDIQTGEALVGANVVLLNTAYGAATDLEGSYSIQNVPTGQYILRTSYIGFEKKEIQITVIGGKVLNVDMQLRYSGSIDLEEVKVTAQAKGQMAAINEQLSSNEIKNVVSKSRIQELPDANAAESVGRLPGVSILREGGEGNKVVIRGLSPKYNKVMIEGVEVASTSGADRSVDMSMISSYSLDGIEVIKAITPDRDGDFIGGIVNFKLHQAEPGLKTNLVLQGGYNGLKETYNDYNLVGSISNRFFNNSLGVFLQLNAEKRNRSSNNMNAYYYMTEQNQDKVDPVFTGGLGLTDVVRERRRYGGTLVFDYNISDGRVSLKNFYNVGNSKTQLYSENYASQSRSFSIATTDNENELSVYSNVLDYEQQFSTIKIDAKISHSYSENKTPYSVSFDFNQTSALDQVPKDIKPIDIPSYATRIDNNKLYFGNVGDATDLTQDRRYEISSNLKWDFNVSSQINGFLKFGGKLRHIERSYDYESTGGVMGLASGRQVKDAILNALGKTDDVGNMTLLPFAYFMNPDFDHGEFLKGKYTLGSVVNANIMRQIIQVMRHSDIKTLDTYSYQEMNSITNDYSGYENLSAGYIMLSINILSNIELIPGIRYEHNRTTYTAAQGNSSGAYPQQSYPYKDTTSVRNNGLWLPMLHFRFKPFDWVSIHFAYTNSLSRPDFNVLIPRQDIGQTLVLQNRFDILPEKSENLDLYFSFHENYLGLLTIGGFTKNIKDKIFWTDQRALLNPIEYGLNPELKNKLIVTQENFNNPVKLKGIEIDWQTNFWYLPSFLKGLVFNINYTHITSEAKYPKTTVNSKYGYDDQGNFTLIKTNIDTTYTDRLVNQPNDIVNISLGYDYKNFSVRMSMLYQSNIFSGPDFNPEMRSFTDDYLRWDLSIKQTLPWMGIQFFCNINNINQAVDIVLNQRTSFPISQEHYGRTIDLGLRLKL